jgi:hypothetical protein
VGGARTMGDEGVLAAKAFHFPPSLLWFRNDGGNRIPSLLPCSSPRYLRSPSSFEEQQRRDALRLLHVSGMRRNACLRPTKSHESPPANESMRGKKREEKGDSKYSLSCPYLFALSTFVPRSIGDSWSAVQSSLRRRLDRPEWPPQPPPPLNGGSSSSVYWHAINQEEEKRGGNALKGGGERLEEGGTDGSLDR